MQYNNCGIPIIVKEVRHPVPRRLKIPALLARWPENMVKFGWGLASPPSLERCSWTPPFLQFPTGDGGRLSSSFSIPTDRTTLWAVLLFKRYQIKSLLFSKNSIIIHCQPYFQIEPKRGIALVNGYGARVNFTFVQKSPFHPTTSHITGRNLKERAGAFHIHVFPKLAKMKVWFWK